MGKNVTNFHNTGLRNICKNSFFMSMSMVRIIKKEFEINTRTRYIIMYNNTKCYLYSLGSAPLSTSLAHMANASISFSPLYTFTGAIHSTFSCICAIQGLL